MKKYEVTEEFILEAHKAACCDWKGKLEKEFPDLFKQPIKGEWYRVDDVFVINFQKFGNGSNFGFHNDGEWGYQMGFHRSNTWVKLTPEEIKSHLIKEAERRGYVKGVKVHSLQSSDDPISGNWHYADKEDCLYAANAMCGGATVYMRGKWAEIIPTKLKITKEEIAKKFGKEVHEIELI